MRTKPLIVFMAVLVCLMPSVIADGVKAGNVKVSSARGHINVDFTVPEGHTDTYVGIWSVKYKDGVPINDEYLEGWTWNDDTFPPGTDPGDTVKGKSNGNYKGKEMIVRWSTKTLEMDSQGNLTEVTRNSYVLIKLK